MNANGIGQAEKQMAEMGYGAAKTEKTKSTSGSRDIGNPKLSDKAQKYYDQLKKKYSNMEFVLVSEDRKNEAQANIGNYKSGKEMLVLIDTEKVEKMAADEDFRKKYEGIISGATAQLAQIKVSLGSSAGSVKSYGMQINDKGIASFFAVVDSSMAAQKKLLEKKSAQKASDKKKAAKEERQKQTEELLTKNRGETDKTEDPKKDSVTVTATSIEELLRKINDVLNGRNSDAIQTEEERMLGQHVNYTA